MKTQQTTALASVQVKTNGTLPAPAAMTNDQLADIVMEGVKQFRFYLPYVAELKLRFQSGERNSQKRLKSPIKQCDSWEQFCETCLDRTPSAVHRALAKVREVNHVEKRKNRATPPNGVTSVTALAKKIMQQGYEAFKGKTNASDLAAATDLVKSCLAEVESEATSPKTESPTQPTHWAKSPRSSAEQAQAQNKAAQELQASLVASGVNATVNRSNKAEGKFHITFHNVSAEQARELANVLSSEKVKT